MMRRIVVVGLFALAWTSPLIVAAATTQRTFVASHGNDTFPCTIPQPCRTFATALAKTSDKGEVIVLDSAGYGPVTIAQSVSILAPAAVYAGITVFDNTTSVGIIVDGNDIRVALRGLSINGEGGHTGIRFDQGAGLTVEDCEVSNMTVAGISTYATNAEVTINHSVMRNNGTGFAAIAFAGTTRVTVGASLITNSTMTGVFAGATSGGSVPLTLSRSTVTQSGLYALEVSAYAGGSASILSDDNTVTYASVAFKFDLDGGTEAIFTRGNNTVGYVGFAVSGGALTSCCGM